MYLLSGHIEFKITSGVEIRDANKLLFILTSNCKEDIIAFLYPFDLLKGPFIIPLSCDDFQHSGVAGFIEIEIKVNQKSMQIVVISENSEGGVIQLIKMFCFKFHEILLNRFSETMVFNIHCSVLIDFVYDILVE